MLDWRALIPPPGPVQPVLPAISSAPPAPAADARAEAIAALASVWPRSGNGHCHHAALALGGVLADSDWSISQILSFAADVFAAAGVDSRTEQVAASVSIRRGPTDEPAYGWPRLRQAMDDRCDDTIVVAAACRHLQTLINPDSVPSADARMLVGDSVEIAQVIMADQLRGALYDEGSIWLQDERGIWVKIDPPQVHRWVVDFSGREYAVKLNEKTGELKGTQIKVDDRKCRSVYNIACDVMERRGFFSGARVGVAFMNGFLDPVSLQLYPLEGARVRQVLPFDWDPDTLTRPDSWLAFLRSVWDDDVEAIRCIHEMLGYLLSGQMQLQKMFVLIGPPRAGKGVILRLLKELFHDACGSFKISALDREFALAPLLGKTVVVDPDVRKARGLGFNEGAVTERLLSLSAGDAQTVPRKYREDVDTILPCRIIMAANPPFGLADTGSALSKRMILIRFPQSFLGREDLNLSARLSTELPSIVALALDGLATLTARGRFVEPESAHEERMAAGRIESPMLGFIEDECVLEPDSRVPCAQLYEAARQWCETNGHHAASATRFSETLRQLGVRKVQPRADGQRGPRCYVGIRLEQEATLRVVGPAL